MGLHAVVKFKIVRPNAGKREALQKTVDVCNEALAFYTNVYLQNPDLVRKLPLNIAQIQAENLTVRTKNRPVVQYNFKAAVPDMPTYMRRSVINDAYGRVSSYLSNKERDDKTGLPTPNNWPTFYIQLYDIQGNFARIKLYDGERWRWMNLPVRYSAKQLRKFQGWKQQAATLVHRPHGWYLHVAYEAPKPKAKQVARLKEDANLVTVNVDLNLNHYAVVSVIQQGRVKEVRFIRGHQHNHRRMRLLRKITQKQYLTGRPIRKGEPFCKDIWAKVSNQNENIAHHVSKEIVGLALAYKSQGHDVVLVFEHLGQFRRKPGEKRSRHLNRKLTHWLRGRIYRYTKYKAWRHGIVTCRVSPKFTSQACSRCGCKGERFGTQFTKANFRCPECHYTVNADLNATFNINKRFWGTFTYHEPAPRQAERRSCELRQEPAVSAPSPLAVGA